MSKHHNYNKMYNSGTSEARSVEPEVENEPAVTEGVMVEAPIVVEEPVVVDVPVEETVVEAPETSAYAVGIVVNCNSLNVREHADRKAGVITVLRAGTEVQVDVATKLDAWVHVYTATGLDGFCMKEYIDVKE